LEYFKKAYFIYDESSQYLEEYIKSNEYSTDIISIHIDDFSENIFKINNDCTHAVISISEDMVSRLLVLFRKYSISIGILNSSSQKEALKSLEVVLQDNCKSIDLCEINGEISYSQGTLGTVFLIGNNMQKTRHSFLRTFLYAIRKFFTTELQKFEITTHNGHKIVTAGTALILLSSIKNNLISRMYNFEQSARDGNLTLVILSPYSILEYFKLIFSIFISTTSKKQLPKSIGYIKSKSFIIKASHDKKIHFDSKSIELPIECKIIPEAIKINADESFWEENTKDSSPKETLKISNLPDKTEAIKYMGHRIPLLEYASEDRFKELFQVLRGDAKLNSSFLVLMILSTLLATFGLFANSTAVIIGAMLVAPLMTPIVSVSMGLLRADTQMTKNSLIKIGAGVLLALISSSLLAFMLPSSEITNEMHNRINPTLLDLAIAIFSGVAAAYSKSFKEIAQNLAGVAIAVALVPPLAVAGIGLGYGDFSAFFGAFLLFFTNLVGIIIAAVITFQLLGFSSALKSKKSVAFIFSLLLLVSYPLYLSYDNMIDNYKTSKMLTQHRFLVNDKYIIVTKASIIIYGDTKILNLNLLVRESLSRADLEKLKIDIHRLFQEKLFIKTKIEYIL
jgi:uncharacterized hydrophobic protein (TIGR00271 family)